jgi:hypothetical protein
MARGKSKLRGKHWHHRVPDFKLVYCGPKKSISKNETINPQQRIVEVSVMNTGKGVFVNKLEKADKSGKSIQLK